jgi:esterase/lipase superfamily enzyme
MKQRLRGAFFVLLAALLASGCATGPHQLMPTPTLYQLPGGQPLFDRAPETSRGPDPNLDLLFITDRARPSDSELGNPTEDGQPLPYGQQRARHIAFGSAQVRVGPGLDWEKLREQSRLAQRTREVDLELGEVRELGAFPEEPYRIARRDGREILRDRSDLARHAEAKAALQAEVQRRLAQAPKREVLLFVHGFNETFATAAYTAADLCHFFGREPVCAFFTWPASSSGNFLTSYTTTTESAEFAVDHLKKTIRMLGTTAGVERVQILAHSRGTALTLRALAALALEAIVAGKDPAKLYKIDNLVLFSPDIDVDVAGQQLTSLGSDPDLPTPRANVRLILNGRFTIYSSPEDRALAVSQLLFRSRERVGQLRPEDIPDQIQRYFESTGHTDLISYEGKRTDFFGHSYFTSNPRVSSDLIQLIRYGKGPGDPGRDLIQTGRVTWRFPVEQDRP